jgi:hypothetical protein
VTFALIPPHGASRGGRTFSAAGSGRTAGDGDRGELIARPLWAGGTWRWYAPAHVWLLLLSVALQLGLAALLGHSYDTRVSMAAGYLVGSGHDPYTPIDLTSVFHHAGFGSSTTIGYPPPWPLLLGLIYRATYAHDHNLLVYGLAIKVPVIAAGVALAYLVASVLTSLGVADARCRKAWLFLLFNPLVLYCGAAWGQIDALVALLALGSLILLYARRSLAAAVLLALAVCVKPVAAPILLVALAFLAGRSWRGAVRFLAVFAGAVGVFYLLPFLLPGWKLPGAGLVNAHFTMSGALSYMSVVRLVSPGAALNGHWWLLGLLWIPALAVAGLALRRGVDDFGDLVVQSTALVLVFFLMRTWLAEPDVMVLLPLLLIAVSLGRLPARALTLVWTVTLVFTLLNRSALHLLWVLSPGLVARGLEATRSIDPLLWIGRAALAAAWLATGWWIVVACLRHREQAEPGRGAALAGQIDLYKPGG